MENNKALNVSCNFNGYLVCQIPANTVEVELKIKTTRGKYTLIKDAHMRTERYHPWDAANRRAEVHTIKRRTPRRETVSKDIAVDKSTGSEMDIPNGEGFAYAPNITNSQQLYPKLKLSVMKQKLHRKTSYGCTVQHVLKSIIAVGVMVQTGTYI